MTTPTRRPDRIVAVEEAVAVPDLRVPRGTGLTDAGRALLDRWEHRMLDVGDLRLADMDEHGIDVQVLSLTAPGVEAIEDPALAVVPHAGSTTTSPPRSARTPTGSRPSRPCRCRTPSPP